MIVRMVVWCRLDWHGIFCNIQYVVYWNLTIFNLLSV